MSETAELAEIKPAEGKTLSPEQEIDNLTVARNKSNKKTPVVEQPANLGKGEEETIQPVETKIEAKVEETKTEEKKEPVEEVKSKRKKFWKPEQPATPEAVKTETTTTTSTEPTFDFNKLPKEIQDKLKRADQVEEILNRSSVKTVLKLEESGKDFDTAYKELQSANPYNMAYKDIYKAMLDEEGYSETEKQARMDRFDEKDEFDQADIITPFRKELKARFDKDIQSHTPKFEKAENPLEKTMVSLNEALPTVAQKWEGKVYQGILATPERVKSAMDINKPIVKMDKNGVVDPEDFFRVKYIIENYETIADTIVTETEVEISEEFKKRYNLPLSAETGKHEPSPTPIKTETKKRVDALMESLPK